MQKDGAVAKYRELNKCIWTSSQAFLDEMRKQRLVQSHITSADSTEIQHKSIWLHGPSLKTASLESHVFGLEEHRDVINEDRFGNGLEEAWRSSRWVIAQAKARQAYRKGRERLWRGPMHNIAESKLLNRGGDGKLPQGYNSKHISSHQWWFVLMKLWLQAPIIQLNGCVIGNRARFSRGIQSEVNRRYWTMAENSARGL